MNPYHRALHTSVVLLTRWNGLLELWAIGTINKEVYEHNVKSIKRRYYRLKKQLRRLENAQG
jgi:hypothetical protein